jgi:hypothetical protein
MGIKMPEVRPRRAVLFSEIGADALAYSKEPKASYPGDRSTVKKLLPVFGTTAIDDQRLKPNLFTTLTYGLKCLRENRRSSTDSAGAQFRTAVLTQTPKAVPLKSEFSASCLVSRRGYGRSQSVLPHLLRNRAPLP